VGCPQTYQLLGQIIHNKSYACGASPFSLDAMNFYRSISDISNKETIPILTKYNIDTIFISNKLINDANRINRELKNDPRLIFVGQYSQPKDEGYISANDLSRDISVYQIKEVLQNKKNESSLISVENGHLQHVIKVDPYRYIVTVNNIKDNFLLNFNAPFSDKWEIYSGKHTQTNDLSMLTKQSDLHSNHIKYNEYANSWLIDNSFVNTNSKDIDSTFMIYFKPHALNSLGNLVSYSTMALLVLIILVLLLKKRYT
jgi:hypothetical protein